jgi:predicted glycosyltransferase
MYTEDTWHRHPRIMIYSQDGLGLGHMRRTSSIAEEFLRRSPDSCVLTMIDSRLGHFFGTTPGHDYLKLPSIRKVSPGNWSAVNLRLPFSDIRAVRQEVMRSAVLQFRPDIFLVDHMPHGAMSELLPVLNALKTATDARIVLGLRDIVDAPEVVRTVWQVEGAYEALSRYYDAVLVYGRREVFNLAEEYHFPAEIVPRLRYCGYVCTPATARHATRTRRSYITDKNGRTNLIVAMAGGGADGYPMMRALLDALPAIQAQIACEVVLITGPLMPHAHCRDLRMRARHLQAHVITSVGDTLSYIEAADLLVAMAGYNTTAEILRSGKRAILIPRSGPSAEQRMRAALFADKGWVNMIDPDDLGVDTVTQSVVKSLVYAPAMPHEKPDLSGLSVAVDQLFRLLASTTPPDQAYVPVQPTVKSSIPVTSLSEYGSPTQPT